MSEDVALWESFRQGDRSAMADLFCAHYDLLERYGRKVVPEESARQDLIHDIFIDLWERKTPPPVTSIQSYLLGALRNKILAHFREKRKRSGAVPLEMDFQMSAEDFIVEREEERERIERLLKAVEQIPPRQREILYLRYYCRLEYADICQMMGITYQVARNQLSLALASVRRSY